MTETNKTLVGAIELCDLPDLLINDLTIRVDTGAQTSSLHVDDINEFTQDNMQWVNFSIHPDVHNVDQIVRRKAPIHAARIVKSSNGTKEKRYVIITHLRLGNQQWPIELTLTDRSDMSYLMLLGRQAMEARLLVDPSLEYVIKKPVSGN